jgi:hypothetical protein
MSVRVLSCSFAIAVLAGLAFREFSEALEKRAIQKKHYVYGKNIPGTGLPDWVGTSVNISSSTQTTRLIPRHKMAAPFCVFKTLTRLSV